MGKKSLVVAIGLLALALIGQAWALRADLESAQTDARRLKSERAIILENAESAFRRYFEQDCTDAGLFGQCRESAAFRAAEIAAELGGRQ